jgi:hypothetical protein
MHKYVKNFLNTITKINHMEWNYIRDPKEQQKYKEVVITGRDRWHSDSDASISFVASQIDETHQLVATKIELGDSRSWDYGFGGIVSLHILQEKEDGLVQTAAYNANTACTDKYNYAFSFIFLYELKKLGVQPADIDSGTESLLEALNEEGKMKVGLEGLCGFPERFSEIEGDKYNPLNEYELELNKIIEELTEKYPGAPPKLFEDAREFTLKSYSEFFSEYYETDNLLETIEKKPKAIASLQMFAVANKFMRFGLYAKYKGVKKEVLTDFGKEVQIAAEKVSGHFMDIIIRLMASVSDTGGQLGKQVAYLNFSGFTGTYKGLDPKFDDLIEDITKTIKPFDITFEDFMKLDI